MKKIPIVINVDGGIVESVDSPVDLNILVLDYDKHGDPELSASRRDGTPTEDWTDRINEIRNDLIKHGEHDIDLKQFSDILTTHHLPVIEKIKIKTYYDDCPDTSHLGEFTDNIRIKGLESGDWCYIGIMAEATIKTPTYSPGCYRLETFTSGGLWGIESDAGEEHIKEIQAEELEDLKRHLSDYGVNLDNWEEIAPEATGEIEDIDML